MGLLENVPQRPAQLALVICSGRFGFPLLNAPQIFKKAHLGYNLRQKSTPNQENELFGIHMPPQNHPKSSENHIWDTYAPSKPPQIFRKSHLGYNRPLKPPQIFRKSHLGYNLKNRQRKPGYPWNNPVFSTVTPFCGSLLWKNPRFFHGNAFLRVAFVEKPAGKFIRPRCTSSPGPQKLNYLN